MGGHQPGLGANSENFCGQQSKSPTRLLGAVDGLGKTKYRRDRCFCDPGGNPTRV